MKREIRNFLNKLDRRSLNNTQKVLYRLLNAEGDWVARTTMQIPSVAARLRDLRKEEFGGFTIRCATAQELHRRTSSTFYALDLASVSLSRVSKAFRTAVQE